MKKILAERNIAVALFVLVLVVFSFAQRDTKKQFEQHNTRNTVQKAQVPLPLADVQTDPSSEFPPK